MARAVRSKMDSNGDEFRPLNHLKGSHSTIYTHQLVSRRSSSPLHYQPRFHDAFYPTRDHSVCFCMAPPPRRWHHTPTPDSAHNGELPQHETLVGNGPNYEQPQAPASGTSRGPWLRLRPAQSIDAPGNVMFPDYALWVAS